MPKFFIIIKMATFALTNTLFIFLISLKNNAMARNEKTSKSVASTASKLLRDPNASKDVKRVAASALTQAPDKKKK